MNEETLVQIKRRLLGMLDEALQARNHKSLDEVIGINLAEDMKLTSPEDAVNRALQRVAESHVLDARYDVSLFEIELAIDRLNKGTYGVCVMCRGQIEPSVLEVNPTTRICKKCFGMWKKFQ
ncbi:MAG TPA: hypothetical protein VIH68_03845 [Bacteroidota bacterium]